MFQRFFCDKWYDYLAHALREAQESEVEEQKDQLLTDLYQRIETMKKMATVTDAGDARVKLDDCGIWHKRN